MSLGPALGRPYRVEARLAGRDERGIHTTAVITSGPAAKVAVEAEAVFAALGPAQASAAIGTEVAPEHRGYLNER